MLPSSTLPISEPKRQKLAEATAASGVNADEKMSVENLISHAGVTTTSDLVNNAPAKPAAKSPKPPKEKDPRFKDGKWTDEEEQRFSESLERFGRDWEGVSNHIGTRDKNAIRSHAQKFFIKLYRDRKPLPAKVAESGMGYTLSGKPLDPDSAAAKQYLGKAFFKKREDNLRKGLKTEPPFDNFNGEKDSPLPEKTLEDILAAKAADEAAAAAATVPPLLGENVSKKRATPPPKRPASVEGDALTAEMPSPVAKKPVKKVAVKKKPFREGDLGIDIGQLLYGSSGENFRVKERLRDRVAISWKQLPGDQDRDPLTLIKPAKYSTVASQPFTLQVHTNALVVADLHAHMARVEIIGFLAGHWDHTISSTSCHRRRSG